MLMRLMTVRNKLPYSSRGAVPTTVIYPPMFGISEDIIQIRMDSIYRVLGRPVLSLRVCAYSKGRPLCGERERSGTPYRYYVHMYHDHVM
jgi:hypothetical protein